MLNFPGRLALPTLLFILLILAVADLLIIFVTILLLVFAGLLFGIFLNSVGHCVTYITRLSYRWAFAVVVVVLFLCMALGFYYFGSLISQQATEFSSQLRSASSEITRRFSASPWAKQYLPDKLNASDLVDQVDLLPELMHGLQSLLWLCTAALVVFFVGLYAALDPGLYTAGILQLASPRHRDRTSQILERLHHKMRDWIVGRLISMTIIGVSTAIGLWLLDIPLPIPLGIVAALLTFIPNIGPIVAAIPQAMLALKLGPNTVIYVLVLNIALQAAESYLITPLIQRYQVSLAPIVTITAQLLMGIAFGLPGVAMAAPVAVASRELIKMLYIENTFADSSASREH